MEPKIKALKDQILQLLENKSSRQATEAFLEIPLDVLDAYLNEKEWDETAPGEVPDEWSAFWLEQINRNKEIKVRTIQWHYWLSAAAVLLVIASAAILYNISNGGRNSEGKNSIAQEVPVAKDKLLINHRRTTETYTLPDHSRVELTPGSTLRFTDPMETSKRSLWLEGEAVFHVTRDPHRPFTVYSAGLATTALGTVFKVTAFKGEKIAQVHLISGKISVQSRKEPASVLYLTAGQQCRFDLSTQKLERMQTQKHPAKSENIQPTQKSVVKTSDAISFQNVPLPEVLQQISTQYKTPIVFPAAQLAKRKFTGSFKKEARLEEVLETLVLLNDLQMKKGLDTIYVRLQ